MILSIFVSGHVQEQGGEKVSAVSFCLGSAQCCVLTNSSPLGVGQAPVENSWGTYKTKNVAQKKLA